MEDADLSKIVTDLQNLLVNKEVARGLFDDQSTQPVRYDCLTRSRLKINWLVSLPGFVVLEWNRGFRPLVVVILASSCACPLSSRLFHQLHHVVGSQQGGWIDQIVGQLR